MVGMTGLFAAAHPQGAVSLRSTLRRLFFSAFSRPPAPPSEPISPWVLIPPYPTIKKPPNGGLFIIGRNDGIIRCRSPARGCLATLDITAAFFFGVLPPAGAAVRTHFSMGSHPTISNHKKTAKRRSFYHWSE